jgi:transcriptional regulator of met regulon
MRLRWSHHKYKLKLLSTVTYSLHLCEVFFFSFVQKCLPGRTYFIQKSSHVSENAIKIFKLPIL